MSIYKRFLRYINPYFSRFMGGTISMALVALLTTATVWLIRTIVDDILIAKDLKKLLFVTLLIPLIYLFKGIFSYIQNYLMHYISQSVIRDIRLELYAHLQNLSLEFFHKNSTGQLMSRLTNDTTLLQNSIASVPVQIVRDGLTLLFLITTIFYLHWKFAFITLILLPLAAIPIVILGSKLRKTSRKIQIQMADLFMSLQEGITGNIITKVFCKEREEVRRFDQENQDYYSISMRWVRADVLGAPIMEFLGSLAAVFLLWYGGKDVIEGTWSAGSFFSFLGASISAYKPMKEFTYVNSKIQQSLSCMERIFSLLDEKPTVIEKKSAKVLPLFKREIQYGGVSFSYDSDQLVLDKIDLKIAAGEILAIVGKSGSGKTTLTHLLPRLFDPTEGSILIDGIDIREVSLESLRHQISIVTQETILFNETVSYNLAYGQRKEKGLSESENQLEIEEAARAANAHEFILHLPDGYQTIIGERGVRLSGGQKQRLSIARAILKNPPILILDEATSSLDTESEKLVQEAIERLMKNRTVLVVAHRLSTVRKADRIIVLENGKIVEEGKHQTLMENLSSYKKLYELQTQQD